MRCCSNRSCGTTGSITVGPRSGQAQKAIDAWVEGYNHQRPYQALAMAVPASRFRPRQGGPGKPGLVVAGDLDAAAPTADRGPVELEVLVPASGNLQRGQIQVGGHGGAAGGRSGGSGPLAPRLSYTAVRRDTANTQGTIGRFRTYEEAVPGSRLRPPLVTPSRGLYLLGLPWQHTRASALLGWWRGMPRSWPSGWAT